MDKQTKLPRLKFASQKIAAMPHDLIQKPLFCKPIRIPYENEILYAVEFPGHDRAISFRSLQLGADIDFIHRWVNLEYAKRFWQFAHSPQKVYDDYNHILQNPDSHSFIGLLNNAPICQVDIYRVHKDELRNHLDDLTPDDTGMHLLMAPRENTLKDLSLHCLVAFLQFYFSFPPAIRMFGEPDVENTGANKLVQRAGFELLKTIQLSYKTANLYSITKQQFHATHQIH
jgi:acetyl CoA:N6-hydroxylysine acetyl transferase